MFMRPAMQRCPGAAIAVCGIGLSFVLAACARTNSDAAGSQPQEATIIEPDEVSGKALADIFSVSKTLSLSGGPLLGSVNVVRVRSDGSLLVGDFGATRQVHSYAANGRHQQSFGKRGDTAPAPLDFSDYGEYVAVLYEGELVLYDKRGERQQALTLPVAAFSAVVVKDEICLGAPYPRVGTNVVYCYARDFTARRIFHSAYGKSRSRLTPARLLSAYESALYVLEPLDPVVTVYSPAATVRIGIQGNNAAAHQVLSGTRALTRAEQREIGRQVSRFVWLWADADGAWLAGGGPQNAVLSRLDLKQQTIHSWTDAFTNMRIEGWKLRTLVGGINGELIAEAEEERTTSKELTVRGPASNAVLVFLKQKAPSKPKDRLGE